jgi:hypothetical protein
VERRSMSSFLVNNSENREEVRVGEAAGGCARIVLRSALVKTAYRRRPGEDSLQIALTERSQILQLLNSCNC